MKMMGGGIAEMMKMMVVVSDQPEHDDFVAPVSEALQGSS
jgi:hypothetical protein